MNQHSIPSMAFTLGRQRQGFVRSRLTNFGLTMAVMGASFGLYYLGLFGSVDGPLTPGNLGSTLAGLGVTQRHVILVLILTLIGALSWNWVFNLTSLAVGKRLTCKAGGEGAAGVCGAPVKRFRRVSRRTGRKVVEYVCGCGHQHAEAHFHPISKGLVGHTIWMACLVCMLIAAFCV